MNQLQTKDRLVCRYKELQKARTWAAILDAQWEAQAYLIQMVRIGNILTIRYKIVL